MERTIFSITLTCLCALFFSVPAAQATLITIAIEAEVDYVADYGNYLEGKIIPGDIITGTYTYDSTTPDSSPLDPVQGNYWHYAPPSGIYLTVGGFDFHTDPTNVEFHIAIRNDIQPTGEDIYALVSYNNLPLSNGTPVDYISWQLYDSTGHALPTDALPTTPPVLTDWETIYGLRLEADRTFLIDAHVTFAVPEPTALLLFTLAGLLLIRKQN